MLLGRLQALAPLIGRICEIAGTPGVSLGVLHHGDVIHQTNFGYRDVEAKLAPNEDTVYLVASLTKAFTAAMIGILVDEGKLNWTTQLQEIFPHFERGDQAQNITITDLLSHRTGLPSYDALWMLSDNKVALHRHDAIPVLNYVPVAASLRTEWIYNNWAYEVLGQVIENVTGLAYFQNLQRRILKPLGMSRTFYTDFPPHSENAALPYVALENSTAFRVPQPAHGKDALIGAAGGLRSSVHDMLKLYSALIDAAHSQIEQDATMSGNPLKQLRYMWQGMISLPLSSVRENSYAAGWVRIQLPAALGFDVGGLNPVLGEGLPSRLGLFHGGNIPGFTSFAAIFPETSSAVIVLSNALGLADTTNLIGQLLVEELFGNSINETYYIEYTKLSTEQTKALMPLIKQELERGKTVDKPVLPLHAYVGTYYNAIGNFFIKIFEVSSGLRVSFMGLESDTFDLEPYQPDSFFWYVPYNDLVQKARVVNYPKEYYILEFGYAGKDSERSTECIIDFLRWKHEPSLRDDGEVFRKSEQRDHVFPNQNERQSPLL